MKSLFSHLVLVRHRIWKTTDEKVAQQVLKMVVSPYRYVM